MTNAKMQMPYKSASQVLHEAPDKQMKPLFDIRLLGAGTQLLIHICLLLGSLVLFLMLFGALFSAEHSWFAQGIFALVGTKSAYFLLAYPLLGCSFVDPMEDLFEKFRNR